MAVSAMLGFRSVTLMTACSNPEDFVNSRTDLFFAALAGCESRSPAPAAAVVRRKSRRVENGFILFVRCVPGLSFFVQPGIEDGVVYCEGQKRGKYTSVAQAHNMEAHASDSSQNLIPLSRPRKVTTGFGFLWDTLPGDWTDFSLKFFVGDNSRKHFHGGDSGPRNF